MRARSLGRAGVLALTLATVLATSSCLRAAYRRTMIDAAPPPAEVAALVPGSDDLESALEALGAPQFVWGLGPDGGEGLALVYASLLQLGWDLNASIPVSDSGSASLEVQRAQLNNESLVLFFDDDWRLERIERGNLDSILPQDLLDQLTGWDDSGS